MTDLSLLIIYTTTPAFIYFHAKNALYILGGRQLVQTFYVLTIWRSQWIFRCVILIHVSFIDFFSNPLFTHWCRVTHICVRKLNIICSDNGLSPGRCQAIISTNAGVLLTWPLLTTSSEIWIAIYIYFFIQVNAFESVFSKTAAILSRPQCVELSQGKCQKT